MTAALTPPPVSPPAITTPGPSAPGTSGGAQKSKEARARDIAEQYEAFFIYQLLENMSAGLKTDGPFGGGQAEATWRSQLNDEYSKVISKRGGIGLADVLQREILRLQEVEP
jgi:Rod binding domain-containing protein